MPLDLRESESVNDAFNDAFSVKSQLLAASITSEQIIAFEA